MRLRSASFLMPGGPVTLVHLRPARWAPTFAIVTSPQDAHDVLGGSDGAFDKEMTVCVQERLWGGNNLFDLPHEPWVPRRRALQPLFTRNHVAVHADRISELTDPATGKPFTDKEIRDDLFAFLFAGHDTTATTLTCSLWQLGRNPGIQERVAPEAVDLGDRPLRANDIEHLPCTVQVIHESLRMCPPGATTGRMAMQDVEVDGYRIPAGTNTVVGIYAFHRDPALWDEPEKFDPERFAPGRSEIGRVGSIRLSGVAHGPVSATVSPCSKHHSVLRASCESSACNPSTTSVR